MGRWGYEDIPVMTGRQVGPDPEPDLDTTIDELKHIVRFCRLKPDVSEAIARAIRLLELQRKERS